MSWGCDQTMVRQSVKGCWGSHLGDVWAFINYCLINEISSISSIAADGVSISGKISEIRPLIESDFTLDVTDEITTDFVDQWEAWNTKYLPTKIQHVGTSNKFTHQLVGGRLFNDQKCVSQEWLDTFESCTTDFNVESVPVGGHLTLEQCISEMAASKFFIGIDSGMSHLAHSVGVPVILVQSSFDFSKFHSGNEFTSISEVSELIPVLQEASS